MKILFLVSRFYPHVGGVEVAALNLGKALQNLGHEVLIVTARAPRNLTSKENIQGLAVVRTYLGLPFSSLLSTLAFPIFSLVSIVRIFRLIKREKVDVLNLHFADDAGFYALVVKCLTGIRLVVSLHGNDVEKFPVESIFRRWLLKTLLKIADAVTVNSKYLEDKLTVVVPLLVRNLTVIGNGINLQDFSDLRPFRNDKPYILFLGRLVHKKGVDVLLNAWAKIASQLNNYELLIAGGGEEHQNLEDLTKQLGIEGSVKFLGAVEHHRGSELMAGASLFVIPSRLEPFGIVALESMAAGCPVLASRTGGLTEIIQDGQTGVLFTSEDVADLVAKLVDLLSNFSRLEGLKRSAIKSVQEFTWDKIALRYLDVYHS